MRSCPRQGPRGRRTIRNGERRPALVREGSAPRLRASHSPPGFIGPTAQEQVMTLAPDVMSPTKTAVAPMG